MPSIAAEDISFSYGGEDVLSSVSFTIPGPGTVAVLGANGSGKSTLMKLIAGLLPLRRGRIEIDGRQVTEDNAFSIRRSIGIVFQDPDSQFVSPVLEEDTAFGPENYGFSRSEVMSRVDRSLSLTGLQDRRRSAPQLLSGGEKERAQLAGVIAVSPDILIFDEAFSMLDLEGQRSMHDLVAALKEGRIVVSITHSAEEAALSDRVILLRRGRIAADGPSEEVLSDMDLLSSCSIRPSYALRLTSALRDAGIDARFAISDDGLKEALCSLL